MRVMNPALRMRVTIVAGMVLAFLAVTATAQKVSRPRKGAAGEWRLIGRVSATHTADHDSIIVRGPHDNFRKIKLKVADAPLNLTRLVVTYDNGEPDRLDVRQRIPRGGESRVIDLRGGKRSLRKIEFWYDTAGAGQGRADVTVFGMK